MAFFQNLGKKISAVSQEAVAKTKDFADVAKLNSTISDENKNIDAAFLAIGKLYVEKHLSDHEAMFDEYFSAISASKKKIEELKAEIIKIKGVRTCPNCGAEVPIGTAYCGACGTKMPVEVPQSEEKTSAEDETEDGANDTSVDVTEEDAQKTE